jgi:phosphonate transport system permease protein
VALPAGEQPASSRPDDRERLLDPRPRLRARNLLVVALVLAVYAWGFAGAQVRLSVLADGLPNILDFLRRLMPPTWKTVETPLAGTGITITAPEIVFAIIETIQMAIVGTTVGVLISLPFGLLAARNTSPHRWVYQATRMLLNLLRAIPEIILGLIFVAAVGLGPFAGVLALSLGALGFMGKQYAEAIEAIDPQQMHAISATGAGRSQTFVYAVVPQALPLVASYSLLLFETNIRQATMLGIVGAGGVGFVLSKYMALFQYQNLMGALILIVLVVTGIDRISDAIRRRLT